MVWTACASACTTRWHKPPCRCASRLQPSCAQATAACSSASHRCFGLSSCTRCASVSTPLAQSHCRSLTLKTGSAPLVQASCAAAEFIVEQCGCSIASVSQVLFLSHVARYVCHDGSVQNCLSSLISVLFECHPYALLARQRSPPPLAPLSPPPHATAVFDSQFDAADDVSDVQYPQSTRDAFNRLIEASALAAVQLRFLAHTNPFPAVFFIRSQPTQAVHSLLPHFSAEHLTGLLDSTLSPLISAPLVDYSQGSMRVLAHHVRAQAKSSTSPPALHPTVLQLRLQQLRFLIICVRCLGGDIEFSPDIFESLLANACVPPADLPSSILRKSTLKAWAAW
jgi:hypothetical protein